MKLLRIACKYIGGTLLSFAPQIIRFINFSCIGALVYLIVDATTGHASLIASMIGAWSVLFIDEFVRLLATRGRKK